MSKISNKPVVSEGTKIRGFYRVRITEGDADKGKIIGDSGFVENQVVDLGFDQYLVRLIGAMANSKQISHVALGTGSAPASGDTVLAGELVDAASSRKAVTAASVSSKTQRFTATFASSDSFVTAARNISNIGLFQQSNTNTATIFSGNTYTSSALATNQNVNITYEIRFS